MDVELTHILGTGYQGQVWATECGRVLKITSDEQEAVISDALRALQRSGVTFRHFPEIHAISLLDDGRVAILRQDVADMPFRDAADEDFMGSVIDDFNEGWSYDFQRKLLDAFEELPALRSLYADLDDFREMTGIRIMDLAGPDNIGMGPDGFVVRDIGRAEGIRARAFDAIAWDPMEISRSGLPILPPHEAPPHPAFM